MLLYAPIIDPNIPGFICDEAQDIVKISVNFMHNMAIEQPQGMMIAIKPYTDTSGNWYETYTTNITMQNNAIFECERHNTNRGWDFTMGDFYKVKIAYCDISSVAEQGEDEIIKGPYSTIGVARCAGNGDTNISVVGTVNNEPLLPYPDINQNYITYVGKYTNTLQSEIVYKYRFSFREEGNTSTLKDTGWLIRADEMKFVIPYELEYFKNYILTYQVITINGLPLTTSYPIIKTGEIPGYYTGQVLATQDAKAIENGYIQIALMGNDTPDGTFRLIRRCLDETLPVWDELVHFQLSRLSDIEQFTWRDFSIEQGKTYVYAVQQYTTRNRPNQAVSYAKKVESQPITASFEHIFIGDGTRQLRLAFNPQISSLKETILEQKSDTLTSRYPFFSRNGNVRYKELPISGLLSYLMDPDELFMPQAQLIQYMDMSLRPDISLTDKNFYAERRFKMEVLEWLNNGEFKVFRSPVEGNYIVRLMNVSLAPNAQVGRMLHTMSATGYEAMEYKHDKLISNKLVKYNEHKSQHKLNQKELSITYRNLSQLEPGKDMAARRINLPKADYVQIIVFGGKTEQSLKIEYYEDDGSKENIASTVILDDYFDMTATLSVSVSNIQHNAYIDLSSDGDLNGLTVTINYIYKTDGDDAFFTRMLSGNYYVFTSRPEASSTTTSDQEIVFIFSLQAINESSQTATFTITYKDGIQETYEVEAGGSRQYTNFSSIAKIDKGEGITLQCYAFMSDTISSTLGAFILNRSPLG